MAIQGNHEDISTSSNSTNNNNNPYENLSMDDPIMDFVQFLQFYRNNSNFAFAPTQFAPTENEEQDQPINGYLDDQQTEQIIPPIDNSVVDQDEDQIVPQDENVSILP